jgi:hypothetical protein
MTLSANAAARVSYAGSGSTGPFAVPFRVLSFDDLQVLVTTTDGVDIELANGTDFTGNGERNATSTIALADALATGETLTIRRKATGAQGSSFRNQGSYFGSSHEDALDALAMQIAALNDRVDAAFKLPASLDPSTHTTDLAPETGKVLAWASSSELTNVTLDSSDVAIPGEGRTVDSVSAFLANNARYNPLDYDAVGNGVADDRGAFSLTASKGPLTISRGTYRIASNLTLAVSVEMLSGALLKPDSGVTITLGAGFNAPLTQVFDLSAGGSVAFRVQRDLYPEWWGALADGVHDDAAALNAVSNVAVAFTSDGVRAGGTVWFQPRPYLCKSTWTVQPFASYLGSRSQTTDNDGSFTYAGTTGTVIRAHTSLYTASNQGALCYFPAGPFTMKDMQFVGTAGINGNSSIGAQFGSTGGSRTHETDGTGGTGGNCSGNIIENCTWWSFTRAWEANNLNDTYARSPRFESNTVNIYLGHNSDSAKQYGNDFELQGAEMFAHTTGIVAGAGLGTTQPHRLRMVGGMMESFTITNSTHVAYNPTTTPRRVRLDFIGTRFQHDIGNAVNPTSIASGTRHFLVNGVFDPPSVSISSVSRTSNVTTVTTGTPHPFEAGQLLTIAGVTDGTFNGAVLVIAALSPTTFTYANTGSNGTSSGGTVTATENPFSMSCLGCDFIGSSMFFGRGSGTALAMNTSFIDCAMRNVAVTLSIAAFITFDGGRWENSSISSTTGQDGAIRGVRFRNLVGTAINFGTAGQPRWTIRDNQFDNPIRPCEQRGLGHRRQPRVQRREQPARLGHPRVRHGHGHARDVRRLGGLSRDAHRQRQ